MTNWLAELISFREEEVIDDRIEVTLEEAEESWDNLVWNQYPKLSFFPEMDKSDMRIFDRLYNITDGCVEDAIQFRDSP